MLIDLHFLKYERVYIVLKRMQLSVLAKSNYERRVEMATGKWKLHETPVNAGEGSMSTNPKVYSYNIN